ncbi:MAG: hypothetical protein AB1696_15410 [Planctomycetota bacterium]
MSPRTRTTGSILRKVGVGLFAAYLVFTYVLAGLHLGDICPLHGRHGECPDCHRTEPTQGAAVELLSSCDDDACAVCQWLASHTPQPEAAPPVVIHGGRIVSSFLHSPCPFLRVFNRVSSPRGPPTVA